MTKFRVTPVATAVAFATLLLSPVVSADPSCGVHTSALDCGSNGFASTPAEQHFVDLIGPHFPGTSATTLVQYARAACVELRADDATRYVAKDLAAHLGTSTEGGGQVMDAAMQADCPNLTVGADGVAR
jgi:hypothetical protein